MDYRRPLETSPSFPSTAHQPMAACSLQTGYTEEPSSVLGTANSQPCYQSLSSPRHIVLFASIGCERENIFSSGVEREAFLLVSVYGKCTSSLPSKMIDILNLLLINCMSR